MVNNNNGIPIEVINKKPFEVVQEVKNEIPSFEEFLKNYEVDKRVINSYENEIKGYGDISVARGYGPMPYVDSQALMIAGSQSIMSRIERDFPKVAELLRWNREATLGFLREKHAFSAYLGQNAFRVPCSHEDNYSKTGPAAWTEYHEKIREYVSEICKRTPAIREHYEVLREAREDLARYIWDEYYRVLPYWPSVGGTNERSFEANKNGSYEHSDKHVVWNCLGWIYVKDERPYYETFKASFDGSPEIKLLMLDLYRMRQIEEKCRNEGIEGAKSHIRSNENTYRRRISWDDF